MEKKQFEYRFESNETAYGLTQRLGDLGKDGWELVSVVANDYFDFYAFLKREIL